MAAVIPHTYQDKHGTYYVRYVFPITIQANLPELGRDIRRSLRTKSPKLAKTRSRRYLSQWEAQIAFLEMAHYRDKQHYIGLIKGFDIFGNEFEIDHGDEEAEQKTLAMMQQTWLQMKQLDAQQVQYKDQPEMLAAVNAVRLLVDKDKQKEKHSVSAVVDAFYLASSGRIEKQSLDELRSGLDLLIHFAGDTLFQDLTKDDLVRFKDLLPYVPPRFHSNTTLRDMPFEEAISLVKEKGYPVLAAKTIEKKVDAVRQLFRWAFKSSQFIEQDFSGIFDQQFINKQHNAAKRGYKAFTPQHLDKLVGCYLYKGELPTRLQKVEPHKFWVPMLLMFTGARLEEVCQLYLQDVVCVEGVWQLRITKEDLNNEGKQVRLKTQSSDRVIPVHPQLLKMGFVDFHEEVRRSGALRLFPELSNDNQKQKYSFLVSKWFGDTLSKQIGYEKGSRYCFHSFRKNVIQALQQITEIPREVRKAIVGHSKGSGDTHEDYERAYDANVLDPFLSQLEYSDLDLNGISWADFKERYSRWLKRKQNR